MVTIIVKFNITWSPSLFIMGCWVVYLTLINLPQHFQEELMLNLSRQTKIKQLTNYVFLLTWPKTMWAFTITWSLWSIVHRKLSFSPLKPLYRIIPNFNLAGIVLGWSTFKIVFDIPTLHSRWLQLQVILKTRWPITGSWEPLVF
jgi:hypothetical protein